MLSAATDPFYVAKEEVQGSIKSLQGLHGEWKRLLHSDNTATSDRFQDVHAEIAGKLQELEYDLQDITATISMVEENRSKFQFDNSEIANRKEFVRSSRTTLRDIKDSVTGKEATAKIDADRRQVLMSSKSTSNGRVEQNSQARSSGGNKQHDDFMQQQRQEQMQIISQQDDALMELSKNTQRLGDTARTINIELQQQQEMLEELDEDIDKEAEKLNFVMKKMGNLLKTNDNKQLCLIIGLVILTIILIFLIIQW